ncbi:hypothetical protein DPX16_1134, partial [Anabarilius grahami]
LLALPSGRDALTCCRRDFRNGSTSCHLSDAPDPTCDTEWIADDIVVVDETGATDLTRVQHAEPQTLILKERHTEINFQMECAATENLVKLSCNDLCPFSDELAATTESQRTNNAGNKSTNDGVFIILSIIIILFTVT